MSGSGRFLIVSVLGVNPNGSIDEAELKTMSGEYFYPEDLFSNSGLKTLREFVEKAGWSKFVINGFRCV